MSTLENVAQSRSSVSIGAKIAPAEARQIGELISAGLFLNESDFESARKEVAGYFKRRGEAYQNEAAEECEIQKYCEVYFSRRARRVREIRQIIAHK